MPALVKVAVLILISFLVTALALVFYVVEGILGPSLDKH
jgi:hypothetical protein